MKLKTFKKSIKNLKDFYEAGVTYDKRLETAFGSETTIMTDWWNTYLESSLNIIAEDMGDKLEVIDWLFFESLLSINGLMVFEIDGVEYEGTAENVWLGLKGRLKPKHGIQKEK